MSGPHKGSFSLCKKFTQLLTNEQETRKLRSHLFFSFFLVCVLIKLGRACGGVQEGGCCQSHKTTQWEFNQACCQRKKTHVKRDWPRSKYQVPPSKYWWIYINALWALHLLVIKFICRPPVPARRLTFLQDSSWAPFLIKKGAQRTW